MSTSGIDLGYLRKYGYEKYRCVKCEGVMWSTRPRETCPDRPCSKYEFLYKDYKNLRPLSLREVRSRFIDFLVKRGHGVVDPYPVLAKWRDDLYLTIASIIVFQPHVTDGLVDPPYNPLVIVQPSIRLTDIDNVGLTFGRHMTSFEMGGMHAFNKPGKFVYWVEGVLDNTIDLFTKEIGLSLDDIVFKESWWEGGGNAGPAPEVLVDGLEVATLVFMKYKDAGGRWVENPVLVVDCGYGIERITWLSQRTPTGFHAVYGSLVGKFKDLLGVEEPPSDVLKKIVYETSDKEISSVSELLDLATKLGFGEYAKDLERSVYTYSILDHTRTLALMLADGIVPSNTGEGYLARLVARRLVRNVLLAGVELSRVRDVVLELINAQINYWIGDYVFGKLASRRDYILEVAQAEVGKFVDMLVESESLVRKIVSRKKQLSLEDLISIYDSYGVPPEIVVEKARSLGINVQLPPDFYSVVAARHSAPPRLAKQVEKQEEFEWVSNLWETVPEFHVDPYKKSTEARVLGVKGRLVVFDRTVIYPRSGGQDYDTGIVRSGKEVYRVVEAYKFGNVIVHVLDREPSLRPGDAVVVEVDWGRRYRLMRHHTATHLVLAAARKVLGEHVWQAGAEKTVEKARLDVTHYKPLTKEDVDAIEKEANRIVDLRIDLNVNTLSRFDAEKKYGIRLYQGGSVYSSNVRVVEIPGFDAQACYGTHVKNTAEVGGIKIINVDRIQEGVVRLEFVSATRIPEVMRDFVEEEQKALSILGGDNIVAAAERTVSELKEKTSLLGRYRSFLKEILLERNVVRTSCGFEYYFVPIPIEDEALRKEVVEEAALKRRAMVVVLMGDLLEVAVDPNKARESGLDLTKVVKELGQYGKGGGKPDHVIIKLFKPTDPGLINHVIERAICSSK
ncbi:alanine--tRNA ligase [Thermogladius sp. KZ2Tp1]|uniref:alanine--tRNA ligase n=1 Tax=Thermogladius sp. KZ2Tp1 TaxID=3136289 RepID=UPI003DA9BA08